MLEPQFATIMKAFVPSLVGLCLAVSILAQGPADDPLAPRRTPAELEELLGPIALYPDPLVALILPASTVPSDVVLGARFVASGGDPAMAEYKPWDSSVKALTRYPDTLRWMDENLEWTTQVGDAFIDQPVEVMEAIQRLRARAQALGNLVDTPQQRIIRDESDLRIIPAQPEYIFEPRYDPDVIFYERPVAEPLLLFGLGFSVGSWLNYDCDWHHRRLYHGDWHEGWDYGRDRIHRDRRDVCINNRLSNTREWRPDPARHRAQSHQFRERVANAETRSNRLRSENLARTRAADLERIRSANPAELRNAPKHHAGIARPKAIANASRSNETIRRAEGRDGGKPGRAEADTKGRKITPKSAAPGLAADTKQDRGGRDPRKLDKEAEPRTHRADAPPGKRPEVTRQDDAPKHDSKKAMEPGRNGTPKSVEPRRHDAPKHVAEPKRNDPPKRVVEPKRNDAPKHVAEPRRNDPPKRVVEPKRNDAPKYVAEPKRNDPPKRVVEPKRNDAPKHVAVPRRNDPPKRVVEPKRNDAPKRVVAPKHHPAPKHAEPKRNDAPRKVEAKPRSEPPKTTGKKSDGKKDDEKKRKA